MFVDNLRNKNIARFKGSFDIVEIEKNENEIIVKKLKTGFAGIISIFVFILFATGIVLLSKQWLVYICCTVILLSISTVITVRYHNLINIKEGKVYLSFKLLFFSIKKEVLIKNILDWKVVKGEVGHYIKLKVGTSAGIFNRIKDELILCRVGKYKEALDFVIWLREIIKPQ